MVLVSSGIQPKITAILGFGSGRTLQFWASGDLLREFSFSETDFFIWQIITDQHQLSKILVGFLTLTLFVHSSNRFMLRSKFYTSSTA